MAKFRRGVNCVTPELYAELKAKLTCPSDDNKVKREYKISDTTCRNIRNTANYEEYRARLKKNHQPSSMKALDELVKNAKYDRREPNKPNVAIVEVEHESADPLARAVGVFLLACMCLIIVGITVGVLKWAFGS